MAVGDSSQSQNQITMKSSVMFALDESPCSMGALNWLFTSLLKDKDHLSVVAWYFPKQQATNSQR